MKEVELKARIEDVDAFRNKLKKLNAKFIKKGLMRDYSFDFPDGNIWKRKETLRIRFLGNEVFLSWKGPVEKNEEYKVREEEETRVENGEKLIKIFKKTGLVINYRRDLNVEFYELNNCILRIEVYPKMFNLVELEGVPKKMGETIKLLGMKRSDFLNRGLAYFIKWFEKETGEKAKIFYEE